MEWDFSFVGAPRDQASGSVIDDAQAPAADDASHEWDFSFVGNAPGRRNAPATTEVWTDDEMAWDFSFAGPPTVRAEGTTADQPAEDVPVWDFSFVDGSEPPAPRPAPAIDEHEVEPVPVLEPEPELAPPAPAVIEAAAGAADDDLTDDDLTDDDLTDDDLTDDDLTDDELAGEELAEWPPPASGTGEIERPDIDPTDPLPRDELLDPIATTPTVQVPVVVAGGPVKILTVCTHNRTRSVMSMALLQAGFDRAVGPGKVLVRSLGFGPEGESAIDDAVAEMADRGLSVAGHASMKVTAQRVGPADLILTAEKEHVIKIAEADPDAFRRTFTLPEFCRLAAGDPTPGNRSLRTWMESLSSSRTPAGYLAAEVPEVDDPTGSPRREFAEATNTIESMCTTVVELLASSVRSTTG